MKVGLRVVRGNDWKWGDQDGGEGGVGTIAEVGGKGRKIPNNVVVVVWDNGAKANYRAGYEGTDDLKVLDSAVAGIRHGSISCDVCKESGVKGTRWKCEVCVDFDLCHVCYMGAKHDLTHVFTRWDTPLSYGVKVPPRASARRIIAKGIYNGAKVVRGTNWTYKNQDGGPEKQGVVQSIGGSSEGSTWRSWVKVKWDVGNVNDYRRGHEGNMDVKCVQSTAGESFYPDHLSTLSEYSSTAFSNGDSLKVNETQLPLEAKKNLAPILGKVGKAIVNEENEEVLVKFKELNNAIRLPTSFFMKVTTFHKGDIVMIQRDLQTVIRLQNGHGGWNDQMKSCLGKEAQVIGLDSDGDVKVQVDNKKWILNPECCSLLTRAAGNEDSDDHDDNDDDDDDDDETTNRGANFLRHFLEAMLQEAVGMQLGPKNLMKMAAQGNLNAVQAIIKNFPGQVDFKEDDMTALQVAAHQGHFQIVTALVNAGANLEAKDNNGDNVLHFATIGKQPEVLEFLLKHNPTVINAQNNDKRTCVYLSVIKQHLRCLQILLNYGASVNIQDKDGDTALHTAVERPDVNIQDLLINHSKTDFKLKNDKEFNVFHVAALKNNANALGKLVAKAPHLVNVAKSDGFTALHICAINGYKNAAEVLISKGKANLNMKNAEGFTPLLLAVNSGRCSMIELLAMKGAEVNADDKDGDTSLHLAIRRLQLKVPDLVGLFAFLNILTDTREPKDLDQAPTISKILSELPASVQQHRTWIAICCFLLQNGADLEKPNHSGRSVGSMIGENLRKIFSRYIKEPVSNRSVKLDSPTQPLIRQSTATALTSSPPSSSAAVKCMMCLKAEANMTFYPCGHKVTCLECSGRMKTCFSCHENIQEKVRSSVSEAPRPGIIREQTTNSNNVSNNDQPRNKSVVGDTVNCPLCETNVRSVVFLCGHSCCIDCSEPLIDCHVCSKPITRKLKLM